MMLRCVSNFIFHGKFYSRLQLTSNYLHTGQSDVEIPPEVIRMRENDMPVKMDDPFLKPKPICVLCKYDVKIDYKNPRLLSQFVSRFTGKVYGRHVSGLCTRQQKLVEAAIKKAQASGLMPYYFKDPNYFKDPPLFDPDRPFKKHKY